MKKQYVKGIMALSITAVLFLSSCLKDPTRTFSPEASNSNLALLYNSGLANFSADAATGSGLDTITYAVGVTDPNPPKTANTITLGVDTTIVAAYNKANPGITYVGMPDSAYTITSKTIVIPAGQNNVTTTIIINKNKLNPAVSYMIPVKIVSAGGLPISGNYNTHYFHVIGNPIAGPYLHTFLRYNNYTSAPPAGTAPSGGSFTNQPATFLPVSPTEITTLTGYYTQLVRYDFTFNQTGTGATAVFTNPSVSLIASDVTADYTPAGIVVTQPAVVVSADFVHKIFTFQYIVSSNGAIRYCVDTYTHQ